MIQRPQTIYLLLAFLACGLTFFLPYARFLEAGQMAVAEYRAFGLYSLPESTLMSPGPYAVPAWAVAAISTLLPLVAIFLYRKRSLQGKVARLAFIAALAYVVYLFFAIDAIAAMHFDPDHTVVHHLGFYAPILSFPLAFLAVKGIRRDEALIRSVDRLR